MIHSPSFFTQQVFRAQPPASIAMPFQPFEEAGRQNTKRKWRRVTLRVFEFIFLSYPEVKVIGGLSDSPFPPLTILRPTPSLLKHRQPQGEGR